MTAIPQPVSNLNLSDQLKSRLRQVARRRWAVLATVGLLKALITGLVALLAAVLVLGYFQNLWLPIRLGLVLITWGLVFFALLRFLRPALSRWTMGKAAMHIEHESPELHERLSSAIELAGETDPTFRGSAQLIEHLFRQAEADTAGVKPAQVVHSQIILRWALFFTPILLAWAAAMLIPATTHTAMVGLYRVFLPWKMQLPNSLIDVVVKPGDVTIAQGDGVEISAHLAFNRGGNRHATLLRNFTNGPHLSDEMEAAGDNDYQLRLTDTAQSFAYRVASDEGNSPWFNVTVQPRPAISSLQVHCEYPAYTGISASTSIGGDGAIQAVVGTRVTLTVHTVSPVAVDKSQIVMNEGTADKTALPLKQVDATTGDYQAQFTVSSCGEYRVSLMNEFNLTNKDDQPHAITAMPDEPPTIAIRSPEPQVTVGLDDVVPVKFMAHDDFGISKIEAILQVDDNPEQVVPVKFTVTDKGTATGPVYSISVADVLKTQGAGNFKAITYQLKATDNRDPDPQVGLSNKQTLKIDRDASQKFESQQELKDGQALIHAIEKAINQLNQETSQVGAAKDVDPREGLDNGRRRQLHHATQTLPKVSSELASAADESMDSVLADVAAKVKNIAINQIAPAAEDATQAELNVDRGKERQAAAARSLKEINEARDALQNILNDQEIAKALHQAEAARDLADAAIRQQQAADAMNSQDQPHKAMRDQQLADEKLQQAIQQSEALRDPQAQQTAQKLQDLIHKVDDLQKQEQKAEDQAQQQQAATDIQQKANELAQKQEALNQEIQKSADQNKDALQKADANPPTKDQQQDIVKALDKNDLQQAHDRMQQAADQLNQAAQKLADQAKSNDLHPTQQQQAAVNQDQQAAEQAKNDQQAATDAAKDLQKAVDTQAEAQPDTAKPADQAIAQAKAAAKAIEKQTDAMKPQDDAAKQDAAAAKQDAKAAEQAADQAANAGDPKEAHKDLNDAAKDLNQAGQELADAAKENAEADRAAMVKAQQQGAKAAAADAAEQAKEQKALAEAAGEQQKELAQVQNPPPADQAARQQNDLANQTAEAQKQADQLQQQAQAAKNPDVAARAQQANADLKQAHQEAAAAAKAQQKAAQAEQAAANADNAEHAKANEQAADAEMKQAAANQQQAQADLAKAETELQNPTAEQTAQANQQQANGKGQGTPAEQAAQAAQEAAQAQQDASQQNPQAAQQAANALAKAAAAMAKATPGMHPGQPADEPSPVPGQTPESKEGIAAGAGDAKVPASVLDMGITADQWAILPPLEKKDLMNAAQQSGPPAYRQMTKDYFAKIAKIQQGPQAK